MTQNNAALRRIAELLGFDHFEGRDDYDDLFVEVIVRRVIREMASELKSSVEPLAHHEEQQARVKNALEFVKKELL